MILTSEEIKLAESKSKLNEYELIQYVGKALFHEIANNISEREEILIIAGKGNNGADGMVLCQYLKRYHYDVHIVFPLELPNHSEAKRIYEEFDYPIIEPSEIPTYLKTTTVVIDALFGFSFHVPLSEDIRSLFTFIQTSNAKIYSIDINSGAEADTGICDPYTLHSDITYALGAYKPVHAFNKEFHLAKEIKLLTLPIQPEGNTYLEMNEKLFFQNYPLPSINDYKGTYGKALIIGGSYGMAGAASFNIVGARSMGTPFIEVGLPDEIYPILASKYSYPVYLPFNEHNYVDKLSHAIEQASVITFGSGATNMPEKEKILNLIIEKANCPIIFDAEALQLLKDNLFILKYAKNEVILTPHIGEFSALTHLSIEEIQNNRFKQAKEFAKKHHVHLVLKGTNTIVCSYFNQVYINESGNSALAIAGSGDLLAGMILGILLKQKDIFKGICMAVYMHGHLADIYANSHSKLQLNLEEYISLADSLFQKQGF